MTQTEFLMKELDQKINIFKASSERHKKLHRSLRVLTYLLTGLSGMLAGLQLLHPSWTQIGFYILTTSCLLGITASYEGIRKPAELWIHERKIFNKLSDLRRELEFQSLDLKSSFKIDGYLNKMQAILSSSEKSWNQLKNDNPENPVK